MAQCQGSRAPMVIHFLVFMCIRQNDIAKIPKVPGASRNAHSASSITWLVVVTIYCTFLNNSSPPPRQFLRDKILSKKKKLREMFIEQSIELELGGPGFLVVARLPDGTCTPITGYFQGKTKIFDLEVT